MYAIIEPQRPLRIIVPEPNFQLREIWEAYSLSREEWDALLDDLKAEPDQQTGRRLAAHGKPGSRVEALIYSPLPEDEVVRILTKYGIPSKIR